MKLIDVSVRNGTAVVVGMILVMLFGLLALGRIPIQLNPTIDRPIISVETVYPGAAPIEVEAEVTNRLEEKLAATENLRKMRSFSREGQSSINLEFDWGVNKDLAILEINKRLNLVSDLPEDVEEPQIIAVDSEEFSPVIRTTVQSTLPVNEVRELLEDRVGPQIERVPGVGRIQWYGGSRREIQVLLDLAALSARHVSINEVQEALARENQNVRGGKIEGGPSRLLVRTVGQYGSMDEIRRTVVKSGEDGVVRIEDIAEVVDGWEETERLGRTFGRPAVNISISKKSGTNTLEVTEALKAEIGRINGELQPLETEILVNYDASDYIWASIYGVRNNLIVGAVLAILVLTLFLSSWSATLAISLTIPVCSIATFVLLAAFGRSVNVISLAGLAFAAGMVVDNAIVVMENIFRHRTQYGASREAAARDATVEVFVPILGSTLTTLAVFIPILFIQEEAGQLFRDIAYSISFAVGLSMIAAVTIVPMVAARMLRSRIAAPAEGAPSASAPNATSSSAKVGPLRALLNRLGGAFSVVFVGSVASGLRSRLARVLIVGLILGSFFASLAVVPPAEYLPRSHSAFVLGRVFLPAGGSLEGADQRLKRIEDYMVGLPNLSRMFYVVGHDSSFFGMFVKKELATDEVVDGLVADLQAYAASVLPSDYRVNIFRVSDFGWNTQGKLVQIDLRGPDLDRLKELSDELEDQIAAMPEVRNVISSFTSAVPELRVVPDRERLADLGMTSRDLASVVETLLEGSVASLYREGGQEYDLVLKAREGQILHPDSLRAVTVLTPTGSQVRLDDLAEVSKGLGPVTVEHLEQERVISLSVNIAEEVPLQTFIQKIGEDVVDPFRAGRLPASYQLSLSGTADDLARTLRALSASFLLALVIIYLLMAAIFESFIYPFIIMFSVPPAMTGAFLGVWVTGAEFNVITMLGFVLLAGIVVNNGILLVDFALRALREGASLDEAILGAVRTRLRPIFMTSATTVLGMLPLAAGTGTGTELYNGLGAAVVGGLTLSTIFTLILIPLLLATFIEVRALAFRAVGRDPLRAFSKERLAD